jgi:nicotinamidase/pyrazinamidase
MPRAGDALLIVDVQNDFLPQGALGVPRGDEVIPVLNAWIGRFTGAGLPVFATRDWHPPTHASFRDHGGPWPPHCIAGTPGARFPPDLLLPSATVVVSKGTKRDDPGYSAFAGSGLAEHLRGAGVQRLFVGGLATDYCVLHTVRDALASGFEVVLLEDATHAVNSHPGDGAAAIAEMHRLGVTVQEPQAGS